MFKKLSKFQKRNIVKIYTYLKSLPKNYDKFDMGDFVQIDGCSESLEYVDKETYHQCGTSACVVGHGPAAGIKPKKVEGWSTYSERCFTSDDCLWEFLFSGDWGDTKFDTLKDAIQRLEYFILNDFTIDNSFVEQTYFGDDKFYVRDFEDANEVLAKEIRKLKHQGKKIPTVEEMT